MQDAAAARIKANSERLSRKVGAGIMYELKAEDHRRAACNRIYSVDTAAIQVAAAAKADEKERAKAIEEELADESEKRKLRLAKFYAEQKAKAAAYGGKGGEPASDDKVPVCNRQRNEQDIRAFFM